MKKIIKGAFQRFLTDCEKCGCSFEYELTDLARDRHDNPAVECPRCGYFTPHYGENGLPSSREEIAAKNENRCVGCGLVIPEGRQVCQYCDELRNNYRRGL